MKYNSIGEKINEYKMNSTYLNYRPLFDALNHGKHKEAVNRLLEIGPLFDPNVTPYSSGDSLLHVTCRLGRTDFLLHLIENYGDTLNFEIANNEGKKPLHEASQFGHHEVVRILLNEGVDVDSLKRADWTPLMMAVTKTGQDAQSVVKALVEDGNANVMLENKDGWNSFHLAAREGDIDILKLLFKAFPKCCRTKSKNGRTPAHTAALNGNLETLIYLHYNCNLPLTEKDSCGCTPMMDAARAGHLNIVKYLIEKLNQKYDILDNMGRDVLSVAAHYGMTNIVNYLLRTVSMDPNKGSLIDPQMAPIHWCAKEGRLETIKKLVELNANPNLTDNKGRSALHFATYGNHIDTVKYLISFAEDIDQELVKMSLPKPEINSLLKSRLSYLNT